MDIHIKSSDPTNMKPSTGHPYLSLKTGVMIGLILMLISIALVEKTYVLDGWIVSTKTVLGLLPYSAARIAELNQVTNVTIKCYAESLDGSPADTYYLSLETSNGGSVLLPSSTFSSARSNKAEHLRTSLLESLPHANISRWAFILWPVGGVGAFIFFISGFLVLVKR